MTERGSNDLEEQIDQLQKQKELLQFKCRQAGKVILELEVIRNSLVKEMDRLSEENDNLKTLVINPTTGKVFHTGSYGSGGGGGIRTITNVCL